MISLCNKCKQTSARRLGRAQQRGDRFARFGGHLIASRAAHFPQQPVFPEQPQQPAHFRRRLPRALSRRHLLAQRFAHIPVPHPVHTIIRVVERSQCRHLKRLKEPQRSRALAALAHRLAQGREQFAQRLVALDVRERFEVPAARRVAYLRAPGHVGHASAQGAPAFRSGFVPFGAAVDFEVFGGVDGHFASQHTALVVEFDRVVPGPVFDANPFNAATHVGLHFGFAGALASEVAQDLLAAGCHHAAEHELRVDFFKAGTVFEHDVGGVLALGGGVVVVNRHGLADALVRGVVLGDERVEGGLEAGACLRVHELLGAGQVGDGGQTVVGALVGDALGVERAGEPFAAVDAEMGEEGEPGLEAHVHEAEGGVHEVEVEVQAFAPVEFEVESFVGAAAAQEPGAAWLDGAEHRDEALAHRLVEEQLGDEALLVDGRRAEVAHLGACGFGGEAGGVTDARGDAAQVGLEVLVEHASVEQVVVHGFFAIEGAQGALEAHAVKAAEFARDKRVMLIQEGLRAAAVLLVVVFFHTLTQPAQAAGVYFRLRLCRARFICGICG